MKVAFVCTSPSVSSYEYLNLNGGSGTLLSLLNVAYFLKDQNSEVTVIGKIKDKDKCRNEPVEFIDLQESHEILAFLNLVKFDVIIIVGHAISFIDEVQCEFDSKVIYWAHNWVNTKTLHDYYKNGIIDEVVYVSRYQFLKSWKQSKLNPKFLIYSRYIYNSLELPFYTKKNIEEKSCVDIAYLSYPSKNKGFPETIQLVRNLIDQGIDTKLHLLGDMKLYDGDDNSLHECYDIMLNENDEIESFLILHGTVGKFDLDRILSSIDLSIGGLTGSETFCYALAESLAKGIPVVSLNKGGQVDFIEHERNGYLVKDLSDAQRYITGYLSLSYDVKLDFENKAIDSISKFSIDVIGKQWKKRLRIKN